MASGGREVPLRSQVLVRLPPDPSGTPRAGIARFWTTPQNPVPARSQARNPAPGGLPKTVRPVPKVHYNRNSMGQFFQVNWFFGRISKNFFQKITHISIKTLKLAQNRPGPFFGKNSPKKRLPGGPGKSASGPVPARPAQAPSRPKMQLFQGFWSPRPAKK